MDFIFSLPVIDELIVVEVEARGTGVDVPGVVVLDAGGTTCLNRKREIVVVVAGVVADVVADVVAAVVAAVVPVVGAVVATDVGAVVGRTVGAVVAADVGAVLRRADGAAVPVALTATSLPWLAGARPKKELLV